DPAFGRAVDLWDEVGDAAASLAEAEAIVAELQGALDASGRDDLLATSRLSALQGRVRALGDRFALLGVQQEWLEDAGGHPDLGALDARRRTAGDALARWSGRVDAASATAGAAPDDARVAALTDRLAALDPADPSRAQVEAALARAKTGARVD